MDYPLNKLLNQESREHLLSAFYFLFEELDFIFQTKIFLLEQVDLNPNSKNYTKVQRKIEKQIGFFKKLRQVSKYIVGLFQLFRRQITFEFDYLYQVNYNALRHLSQANKSLTELRVKKFEQYRPLSKSHSKLKRATLSKTQK